MALLRRAKAHCHSGVSAARQRPSADPDDRAVAAGGDTVTFSAVAPLLQKHIGQTW
jgi:hypothetical protein